MHAWAANVIWGNKFWRALGCMVTPPEMKKRLWVMCRRNVTDTLYCGLQRSYSERAKIQNHRRKSLIFTQGKPVTELTFMAAGSFKWKKKEKRLVELLFSSGLSFKNTPSEHTNVDWLDCGGSRSLARRRVRAERAIPAHADASVI